MLLPKLLQLHSENKQNSLIAGRLLLAICGALKHLPKTVVKAHVDQLTPLVVQTIKAAVNVTPDNTADNQHNAVPATGAIDALRALLATTSDESGTQHNLPLDITSTALSLCALGQKATSATTRVSALIALRELGQKSIYRSVFPVKSRVLSSLSTTLKDRKRVVRREAARTRNAWFILGIEIN